LKTMARKLSSLQSAHLVMWSSPLLLVVLVFTLTTTPSPSTRPSLSLRPSTTTSSTTTLATPTTTTTTAPVTAHHSKVKPAPSASRTKYADVTAPNVSHAAAPPSESASSGVLSGSLSPGFQVADVPVQGPGLWTLSTSTPIDARLLCTSRTVLVHRRLVIMTGQQCQLQLTSTNPEVSPTWQLTPIT
jgi:hypothetical protein